MTKRFIIAIIALIVVAGGLIGFNLFRDKMIAGFFASMKPPVVTVSTSTAAPIKWEPGIETIGSALAGQGVDLSTEAAGVVREVPFSANDRVEKGALLLQIDDRSERADLESAQASLALAQTELERAEALQKRGVSSANTLQTAQASATAAEATVAKLEAAMETKRLTAPFSGTIGIPQVELGQFVTAGTPYATLQDTTTMRVDFSLTEQQAPLVSAGQAVVVTSEVGDVSAEGKIIGIEPKIDANSRLVTIRASVENPGGLTPGQFLRVRVVLPAEEGVIALPQTVVASSLYGDSVYIVREDKDEEGEAILKAQQVFVTLGRRSGPLVEIVKGVEAGDKVVNAGQNKLYSGATVLIDNSVSPDPQSASAATQTEDTAADAPAAN
ncbi:efflux RND transporter periplasmic adaptor subunit [Albirhodobacter sp. R86504]|uniref:efflux RND transporter periplasmic adaptor subunit n=1 Tax=Albirhodobacter sp. R86504 TaxID=3093848 RepID=UPI00366A5907